MNDPWTGKRSASGENKIFTHLLLRETLRGRLVMSKKSLNAVKNKYWMKMRANSGKSTATVVDLVESTCRCSTLSEVSPRARQNQNNRRSPVFDPSRRTFCTDTRMCSLLEKQAATSPSLDRFRFHWTELQLQLHLFHPPYSFSCCSFYGVTSVFAKQKMGTKSSPNNDEEVLQLSEAVIRRVKWPYKSLLERRGLKMLRFLEDLNFQLHLFTSDKTKFRSMVDVWETGYSCVFKLRKQKISLCHIHVPWDESACSRGLSTTCTPAANETRKSPLIS